MYNKLESILKRWRFESNLRAKVFLVITTFAIYSFFINHRCLHVWKRLRECRHVCAYVQYSVLMYVCACNSSSQSDCAEAKLAVFLFLPSSRKVKRRKKLFTNSVEVSINQSVPAELHQTVSDFPVVSRGCSWCRK